MKICKSIKNFKGSQSGYQWAPGSDRYETMRDIAAIASETTPTSFCSARERIYKGQWPFEAILPRKDPKTRIPEICHLDGCEEKCTGKAKYCCVGHATLGRNEQRRVDILAGKRPVTPRANLDARAKPCTIDRTARCYRKDSCGYLVECKSFGKWGELETMFYCTCTGYEPARELIVVG